MCGIAGYYDLDGEHPLPLSMLVAWALLSERGRQAAGAMWQKRDSGTLWHYKTQGSSGDFAAHAWPRIAKDSPRWAAFHSRTSTKGPPSDMVNNHPVQWGNILVMHNGSITNDDEVFKELKQERGAEVDTVAIAACLATGGIKEVLAQCEGSMSIAWVSITEPGALHLYTNGQSPLWVSRQKGAYLVYASSSLYIPLPLVGGVAAMVRPGTHIIITPDGVVAAEDVGRGRVKMYSGPPSSDYTCYRFDCANKMEHTHFWPSYDYDLHDVHTKPSKPQLALPGSKEWLYDD